MRGSNLGLLVREVALLPLRKVRHKAPAPGVFHISVFFLSYPFRTGGSGSMGGPSRRVASSEQALGGGPVEPDFPDFFRFLIVIFFDFFPRFDDFKLVFFPIFFYRVQLAF